VKRSRGQVYEEPIAAIGAATGGGVGSGDGGSHQGGGGRVPYRGCRAR
jgi:hypothetical protein